MSYLFYNTDKIPTQSYRRDVRAVMATVSEVSGKFYPTETSKSNSLSYISSDLKKSFVGKQVSILAKADNLVVTKPSDFYLHFSVYAARSKSSQLQFRRPRPVIASARSSKVEKLKTESIRPYTAKSVEIVLTEKPDASGVSGSFELEFNMLRGETRTFKFPIKFLQTLENTNESIISGEYMTFTPNNIGEYTFKGQGGHVRIKVSPAIMFKEMSPNVALKE